MRVVYYEHLTIKDIQSAARDLARRPASNLQSCKVLHLARYGGEDIGIAPHPFSPRQKGYFYVIDQSKFTGAPYLWQCAVR